MTFRFISTTPTDHNQAQQEEWMNQSIAVKYKKGVKHKMNLASCCFAAHWFIPFQQTVMLWLFLFFTQRLACNVTDITSPFCFFLLSPLSLCPSYSLSLFFSLPFTLSLRMQLWTWNRCTSGSSRSINICKILTVKTYFSIHYQSKVWKHLLVQIYLFNFPPYT